MDVGNEQKEMKLEAQVSNMGKLADGDTTCYHRGVRGNKFKFRLTVFDVLWDIQEEMSNKMLDVYG